MNQRLAELAARRVMLRDRIAAQRADFAGASRGLAPVIRVADTGARGIQYLKYNPMLVTAVLAAFVVVRPRRALRFGKRAFVAWKGWRFVRERVIPLVPQRLVAELVGRRGSSPRPRQSR